MSTPTDNKMRDTAIEVGAQTAVGSAAGAIMGNLMLYSPGIGAWYLAAGVLIGRAVLWISNEAWKQAGVVPKTKSALLSGDKTEPHKLNTVRKISSYTAAFFAATAATWKLMPYILRRLGVAGAPRFFTQVVALNAGSLGMGVVAYCAFKVAQFAYDKYQAGKTS